MKILTVEQLIDDGEAAWIDDGENYKEVYVYPDNTMKERGSFPKSNYDDYEHFVGVMGKFNPYTIFRKNPVEVDKLDYEYLVELRHSFEKEYREYSKRIDS